MPSPRPPKNKVSYVPVIVGAVTLVILIAAYAYLNRRQSADQQESAASAAAKAYVKNLALSDVRMAAAENFMQQRVVEIEGSITNNGNRALDGIDVYCLFYGVNGNLIHRERAAILRAKGKPLAPKETRPFRLPFDTLPDGWNQAMPHLVIAEIKFAQ